MFINNVLFLLASSYTKQDIRDILNRTGWEYRLRWKRVEGVPTLYLHLGQWHSCKLEFEDTSDPDEFYLNEYVLIASTEVGGNEIWVIKRNQTALKLLQTKI
jgi:hypothetical protein